MLAVCPNSPDHKEFVTVAHEMHEWLVDENGDFIEDRECLQTSHGPNPGNIWRCNICQSEAKVED